MAKANRYINDIYDGVLPINKEAGMTSHDVIGRLRRLYSTRRIGHTGTLDPMATGVLIVLIGRAAKASEYITHDKKSYSAVLRLGITTDTEDTEGEVLTTSEVPKNIDLSDIERRFTGRIMQTPPMYSALKVDGKKLADMARKGITIERQPREITVYSLSLTETERHDEYKLDVCCSGGTYVRTLCADIGKYLGCGGAMASLCRTENYGFPLSACHTLSELEEMRECERAALLLDTETLFADCPVVRLDGFFASLALAGNEIYQRKIGCDHPLGTRVRMCDSDGFFSLGEVKMYEGGSAIKPVKKFRL